MPFYCVFVIIFWRDAHKHVILMIWMSWFTGNKDYISSTFLVAKTIKNGKARMRGLLCELLRFLFSIFKLISASSGGPVDARNKKMWFMKFDMQILIFTKQRKTCFCEFSCLEACQYNPHISYSGVFYTKHEFALFSNPDCLFLF